MSDLDRIVDYECVTPEEEPVVDAGTAEALRLKAEGWTYIPAECDEQIAFYDETLPVQARTLGPLLSAERRLWFWIPGQQEGRWYRSPWPGIGYPELLALCREAAFVAGIGRVEWNSHFVSMVQRFLPGVVTLSEAEAETLLVMRALAKR